MLSNNVFVRLLFPARNFSAAKKFTAKSEGPRTRHRYSKLVFGTFLLCSHTQSKRITLPLRQFYVYGIRMNIYLHNKCISATQKKKNNVNKKNEPKASTQPSPSTHFLFKKEIYFPMKINLNLNLIYTNHCAKPIGPFSIQK